MLLDTRAAAMLTASSHGSGAVGKIVAVSGWRSEDEQQRIWDTSMRDNGGEFTRRYVARPAAPSTRRGSP